MFRNQGLYRELTRCLQPGLIAIDGLRSRTLESAYMTMEFFLNEESYLEAQSEPSQSELNRMIES